MTQTWDDTREGPLVRETATGITRRSDWAALPLRAVLGFGFMFHGYPKLFDPAQNEGFAATLTQIGIPAPEVMAWVVGVVEFVGGLGLLLGWFVLPIAVLGILDMLVAMFFLHLPAGFSFLNISGMSPEGPTFGPPGVEVNLLYIAGFLALLATGGGPWSIDAAVRKPGKPADVRPEDGERYVGTRAPDEAPT